MYGRPRYLTLFITNVARLALAGPQSAVTNKKDRKMVKVVSPENYISFKSSLQ